MKDYSKYVTFFSRRESKNYRNSVKTTGSELKDELIISFRMVDSDIINWMNNIKKESLNNKGNLILVSKESILCNDLIIPNLENNNNEELSDIINLSIGRISEEAYIKDNKLYFPVENKAILVKQYKNFIKNDEWKRSQDEKISLNLTEIIKRTGIINKQLERVKGIDMYFGDIQVWQFFEKMEDPNSFYSAQRELSRIHSDKNKTLFLG